MKEVVFEVVIGVIIIGLLVVVINLFRGNLEIIGSTADKADRMDKVQAETLGVDINKSSVKGSDVVSAIRYYADKPEVSVYVDSQDCSGKSDLSGIDYEAVYNAEYKFEKEKKSLEKIYYWLASGSNAN
ncbi:MAG TPA: hypothetical protein VIO64_12255 [Pseudobacteroides sp.]|uniref:hypothetical protein n=1 Tax=Pseudobacteroides sp. TaxID=1968840 RepID=UPI002F947EFA